MTTSEWFEADQDDADRCRSWPAQDAQEPPNVSDVAYLWAEIKRLRATVARVAGLCNNSNAGVSTRDGALMVSTIRAALEGKP